MSTKTHKPQSEDSGFLYKKYKDRYQGVIKKRARRSRHPATDFTIKRLTLYPHHIPVSKRCGAWPYCDREIRDNNWDIACSVHWFGLSKEMRKDAEAVLNFPRRSRLRKLVIGTVIKRLQLAGKRGDVIRAHMREYTVVDNRREEL